MARGLPTTRPQRSLLLRTLAVAGLALWLGCAPCISTANEPLATTAALTSSGDAELDELRRLAVAAPIEELLAKLQWWVNYRGFDDIDDPVLWQGVDRVTQHALEHDNHGIHENDLTILTRSIELTRQPEGRKLTGRIPALRRAVERIRKRQAAGR